MLGRAKRYFIILCALLAAAFLLNPPVAFATKLPTACNVFGGKQTENSGPCGQRALLSSDKSDADEMLFSSETDFGTGHDQFPAVLFFSLPSSSLVSLLSAVPLRC